MGRYNNKRNDKRKTEMHDAVCSECGKECKVPFKPTTGKPIYCSDCFEKHDDKKSDRRPRRDSRRSNDRRTDMFDAVCDKCGKDCKVPFKPSSDKPIYCSDCFEKVNDNKSNVNTELLEKISKKLDYVIETLKYGESKY
jgi:CxxC-x17-CxxC domain-containing protein